MNTHPPRGYGAGFNVTLGFVAVLVIYLLSFGPAMAWKGVMITRHKGQFFDYGLPYVPDSYTRTAPMSDLQVLYPVYVPIHLAADRVYGLGYVLTRWANFCGARQISEYVIYVDTPQKGVIVRK